MSYAHHKLLTWSLPHLLLLPLTYLLLLASPTGVSANLCRVTGGVLGIHWSSVIGLGWHSVAKGRGGATCWESCCLNPSCNGVWSLGGQCVLLRCTRDTGCPITTLPPPHQESLGLLQLLSKSPVITARRRRALLALHTGSHKRQAGQLTSTEKPKVETARPTQMAPGAIALLQTAQKNQSQSANRSADVAPAPSQQNSTATVDTAPSPNGSDASTPTTAAAALIATPTQAVKELVVSAGESVEVTLPRNEVELNAFVVSTPPPGTNYAFDWRLITHPKDYSGEMEGEHSKTLKLSKLTLGLYEFEVKVVDGEGAHGEGYVNVTVKPEPRVNKPPVAVVSPKFQETSLPTSSTVIDGSQSTDDDKVVAWHWDEVQGPLREDKVSTDTPVLTLTNLVHGNYTFILTVTDSDGATNSTQATLLVSKAKDYRPVANAGPNQVIQLPRNSITLYGNQSTDDHDSLSYEWSLSPESKGKVVEMRGVRKPILQLSAMQEGDYTFQLTVTDSAGQQETAQVTVIVQPENNKPPVADAGPEKELTLPVDRTTLDASKSTDDQKISTYHWKQTKGPDGVKIENADGAVATVTGLVVGSYEFTLTVTDERKLQSTDAVTVIVREELDQPPVAHVVSSPPIALPVRTGTVDGSHSTDDKGGVGYLCTRDDSSPAAGEVLNNSDHQAVLFLGNLVAGKYSFTLTVTDSKGQTSTDSGTVEVKPGVSANLCRVTGGVLGIHWSSVIGLGWHSVAKGRGGATCWESCCLNPSCNGVWSLGGQCVLLRCTRDTGCPITTLPPPHQESLGLLQLLSKSPAITARRRRALLALHTGSHKRQAGQLTSTEKPKVETARPTQTAPGTIALLQTAQKNQSQSANRSADVAPAPSQQNSTATVDTAPSPNGSDASTPTTAAAALIATPTQAVKELVVSAGESVEVTLPRNEVELNAFVVSTPPPGTNYAFDWRLITHPKDYSGEMEGEHSKTLKLSKLTLGLYEFEVKVVDGEGAHGEGYVNVTVKPEPRVNKPPVAVVSPKFQETSLPTSSTVIDGSQSTDDDKVVAWHWDEVKGPLREDKVSTDTPVLTLTNLVHGNYTFILTVTDSDGATNSTQATLLVSKAKDYRPVANAGPNQVIQLPRNSITLYGNQSTDDHDSLSYEWSLSPESKDKVVEMQGVRKPILQLSAMQEGDYTFQLTVTDSAGQQETAQVTVIVQPENNKPPVADAGPEKELTLPVDRTTLDASKSTDDQKISTYHWKQTKGPDGVKIENADGAVATVTGLEVGSYEFTLTVTDERKLQSTDVVTVIVREELDQPPVAHVVSSPPIALPVRTGTLDGSHSTDDKGGVSYLWTRDDSSPAAGEVLNNSDHQAVLFLGNLVAGKYSFTLTVTDSKGQTSTDSGTVEVKPDVWERDLVELVLEVSVSQVSHRQRDMLLRQVGVLLGVLDSDITVREISAFNEHSTRLVFLVSGGPGRPPLSGRSVALSLRNKLRKQKNDFLIYKARRVDTVICQLNCSSHGECDSFTRSCVCQPFWMENFIRAQLGDAESNCEWSVLYVTIASFMIVVAIATVVWGMVCCCNRRKSKVRRSKSRYKMLEADEQDSLELQPQRAARLKSVPAPTSSALMHSDSDLDSDDGQGGVPWTEQERGHLLRPQNGFLRNGQGPVRGKKQREELL